jgi:D-amino-acid oxidase
MSSTSQLNPNPSSSTTSQKPAIAVLGAGITGLQTALSILTSPDLAKNFSVLILAAHLPTDPVPPGSIDYTSPWAGGHWRSHAGSGPEHKEARDWDARTYEEWRRLLDSVRVEDGNGESKDQVTGQWRIESDEQVQSAEQLEKFLGLGIRESVMFWSVETAETRGADGSGLWWKDVVRGFEVMGTPSPGNMDEPVLFAARYESVCINVPRYLKYLMERVTALGGKFVKAMVETEGGVEGVVEHVKRVVTEQSPYRDVDTVVLATGLLSKQFLPKEEADKLYPVRGQTVLVKGEASKATTQIFAGGEISYVIPRPGSGTTILGGCKEVGNWNEEQDVKLTEKILRRAKVMVPELLLPSRKGEFEVLSVQVGRRPGRKGGPRVEMEKERVSGARVVHAYGHEGAGYQNSVGSAEKVVRLLADR